MNLLLLWILITSYNNDNNNLLWLSTREATGVPHFSSFVPHGQHRTTIFTLTTAVYISRNHAQQEAET